MTRTGKVALFTALTYVSSGSIAAGFWLSVGRWEGPAARAVGVLYLMPPAIAALVVKGALSGEPLVEPLGLRLKPSRWYLVAWLSPVVLTAMALWLGARVTEQTLLLDVESFVAHHLDAVSAEQRDAFRSQMQQQTIHPAFRFVLQALIAGASFNLLLSLAEELGWRGFLNAELGGGFWRKSLVTGLIWGGWMLPLVWLGHLHAGAPWAGSALTLAWALLLSPLLAHLREQTGSVFAPCLFRGTLMALTHLPQMLIAGSDPLMHGPTGVSQVSVLGGAALLLALWRRRRAKQV